MIRKIQYDEYGNKKPIRRSYTKAEKAERTKHFEASIKGWGTVRYLDKGTKFTLSKNKNLYPSLEGKNKSNLFNDGFAPVETGRQASKVKITDKAKAAAQAQAQRQSENFARQLRQGKEAVKVCWSNWFELGSRTQKKFGSFENFVREQSEKNILKFLD